MPGSGLVVVVPHHHRVDLLPRTLAAVARWPVVVVHDGPPGTPDLDLPPGAVQLRTRGEEGFAAAVNRGLQHADTVLGAELVLLLNDDAVPRPGCVDALLAAWEPELGAVGPVLLDGAGQVESAGVDLRWWGRVRQRQEIPLETRAVAALSGACLLVSAGTRIPQGYAHGFEDLALCRALRRAGRRCLLVPEARCDHLGGASLGRATPEAQRHAVAGHLRLVHGGWRTPLVLGLAVAQVLREGGDAERLRAVGEGWRDWRRATPGGAG